MSSDTAAATHRLGTWVAALRWENVPATVRERLLLALYDHLGVAAVGARLPEHVALVRAWDPPPGAAAIVGAARRTTPDTAAWLNGTAACALELDEGNKYARGHPAAHGFPAVLAMAQAQPTVDGPSLCAALLAAYEVASRFGRATAIRPGVHPHGCWGVPGAAAGVARLLELTPEKTAAAIDTACGLPIAGHFESALSGNPVRNAWIGQSNLSGIIAARMAAAGTARVTGTAAHSLGEVLGTFDPEALTEELGTRYDVTLNYYKRHASCSFTHPPVDAVLALAVPPDRVAAVDVETHSLAKGLTRMRWPTRLAAMFSTPYAVAAALVRGRLDPAATSEDALRDPAITRLAERVSVRVAADLDARLPDERAARVTVVLDDGTRVTRTVPNPVGDAAYLPFDREQVDAKLTGLLGPGDPYLTRIRLLVDTLPTADDVVGLLATLGEP
ncbi:MmgE/PrpD family protein [Actinoallomurus acanthiterrae]